METWRSMWPGLSGSEERTDMGWEVQKSIFKKVSPGPVVRSRNIFRRG